jgi:tRNA pseudouridine13 synthase
MDVPSAPHAGPVPVSWRQCALAPPRAHGQPLCEARLRERPEDFRVAEDLGFAPDGGPAHVLLRVEKTGRDTLAVQLELARHAGVPARDVGFAGLKDRHAIAEQWFSVPAGRPLEEWARYEGDGVRVLAAAPHSRKLRRGALRGNVFRLVVRGVSADRAAFERRLGAIAVRGVPNYFGPQRFGRDGGNVGLVHAWTAGAVPGRAREQRAFVYSAARGLLFNAVAAWRVGDGSWDSLLPGELVNLDGRRSWFRAESIDAELAGRCRTGDVHPTGPLPGEGDAAPLGVAGETERTALAPYDAVIAALRAARLEAARRPLRVRPESLDWTLSGDALTLAFGLPAGAYATAVVRELVATDSVLQESDDA